MIRGGLLSCRDLKKGKDCAPDLCKVTALPAQRPLRGQTGSTGCVSWREGGEQQRTGDGNEGANCFQWILKSNPSPQCMEEAARKWNIDDRGENKGK